ncbi:hypothetical protein EYF80_014701 [Liparis tanakae]|uniref:Uncharacterized protein n=1 Tax=Liparis tanakae TaxID=230148 RepID=A0A4Z2IAU8_9TELE|nr:hypothetical protein EYF80_014701 [Liparis tanakae]
MSGGEGSHIPHNATPRPPTPPPLLNPVTPDSKLHSLPGPSVFDFEPRVKESTGVNQTVDLVLRDVLPAPAGREHLYISTVTDSHERSGAAHSAAAEDEELRSKMEENRSDLNGGSRFDCELASLDKALCSPTSPGAGALPARPNAASYLLINPVRFIRPSQEFTQEKVETFRRMNGRKWLRSSLHARHQQNMSQSHPHQLDWTELAACLSAGASLTSLAWSVFSVRVRPTSNSLSSDGVRAIAASHWAPGLLPYPACGVENTAAKAWWPLSCGADDGMNVCHPARHYLPLSGDSITSHIC